jgi:AcrR family transcriptional regulator
MRKVTSIESTVETDILDAALHLLDAPCDRTVTINEIAAKSGYSVNTIYRRFPGKDAILRAVAQLQLRRTWAVRTAILDHPTPATIEDVESLLRRLVSAWVHSLLNQRRAKRVLLVHFMGHEELITEFVRATLELATANLRTVLDKSAHLIEPITEAQIRMLAHAVIGNARMAVLIDETGANAETLTADLTLLVTRFIRWQDTTVPSI